MKKLSIKAQQARTAQLMPNGEPKWIRCYDNNGETFDRYTIVFTKKAISEIDRENYQPAEFMYVGASENPYHPQGFYQHDASRYQPIDRPTYGHLGKKIKFANLPEDVQKAVIEDYKELWNL